MPLHNILSEVGALMLPIDEGAEPFVIATQYRYPEETSPLTILFLIRVTDIWKEVPVEVEMII